MLYLGGYQQTDQRHDALSLLIQTAGPWQSERGALEADVSRLEKQRADAENRAAEFEAEMVSLKKGLEEEKAMGRQAIVERDRRVNLLPQCHILR